MLQEVKTQNKIFKDYRGIIDEALYEEILSLTEKLKGLRVLQINATAFGGGVAEILQSLIPLERDLGIEATWQVIQGNDEFFNITKFLHNSFQKGEPFSLTSDQIRIFEKVAFSNAKAFEGEYDIILIHDPQPVALPFYIDDLSTEFIWRLHIDTSTCVRDNWTYFSPFLAKYSACIFSSEKYESKEIPIEKRFYIPPAIDPLHQKNMEIDGRLVRKTVAGMGVDITKPLVTQVSRFDPWKDPIGVVEAYKIAKKKIPELQLALVASMANDDPEGWNVYEETRASVGSDPDVYLILNNDPLSNDLNVNAIQRHSNVIVQKSLKEGFGLVVTEAMWKGKPVVGGDTVGIMMQITDGENGFLVGSAKECAEKIIYLLENEKKSSSMGKKAKESVRKKYLLPRLIRDELKVYQSVLSKEKAEIKK
jgi:trehalose synthase